MLPWLTYRISIDCHRAPFWRIHGRMWRATALISQVFIDRALHRVFLNKKEQPALVCRCRCHPIEPISRCPLLWHRTNRECRASNHRPHDSSNVGLGRPLAGGKRFYRNIPSRRLCFRGGGHFHSEFSSLACDAQRREMRHPNSNQAHGREDAAN